MRGSPGAQVYARCSSPGSPTLGSPRPPCSHQTIGPHTSLVSSPGKGAPGVVDRAGGGSLPLPTGGGQVDDPKMVPLAVTKILRGSYVCSEDNIAQAVQKSCEG